MREGNTRWNSPRDCSCQLEQGLSQHLYYVLHHQRAHRWVWGSNPRSLGYIQRRNQSSSRWQGKAAVGWSRARMPDVPQVVNFQWTGSDVTKWEPHLKGSSPKAVHWGEGILAEQCCMGLPPGIGADGVSQEVICGRNCLSQEPGQADKHLWEFISMYQERAIIWIPVWESRVNSTNQLKHYPLLLISPLPLT